MSIDDLNMFLAQYLRTQFDPSAPLPTLWPTGIWGVFLIFVMPTVVGLPLGVIMARDAGIAPLVTAQVMLPVNGPEPALITSTLEALAVVSELPI